MSEVKNYQEVVDIASKHLGKVGGDGYKDSYDPSLLVKIPRSLNREGYGLTGEEFKGVTGTCSAPSPRGLPSFSRKRTAGSCANEPSKSDIEGEVEGASSVLLNA